MYVVSVVTEKREIDGDNYCKERLLQRRVKLKIYKEKKQSSSLKYLQSTPQQALSQLPVSMDTVPSA